jgi:hypothetical protein
MFVLLLTVSNILPALAITAWADTLIPETSYTVEIDNGTKIFIMNTCSRTNRNPDATQCICAVSGLYYNTDPLVNIYYTPRHGGNSSLEGHNNYMYRNELIFSSDGMYFAHMPWTIAGRTESRSQGPDRGSAIEFYGNGILLNRYFVNDLVENTSVLMFTASHVMWENRSRRDLNLENNILSVTTADNLTYRFDMTTGSIIDENKPSFLEQADGFTNRIHELIIRLWHRFR